MADKHEGWCSSQPPYNGTCDCRDVHPDNAIPHETSAVELLEQLYRPGVWRPPLVQKYIKEHEGR